MNKPTLGSTIMIKDAILYDYNILESIDCLMELCDQVVILDAGSRDGTWELLKENIQWPSNNDDIKVFGEGNSMFEAAEIIITPKITAIHLLSNEWDKQHGSQKLAYFTNMALSYIKTDWHINLQADEIIHESSFPWIRQAISEGKHESYLCKRVNLWGSPYHELNVPEERMPCSSVVLRLAKSKYKSAGDAESLETPECSKEYIDKIRIYHAGFVRNRAKMAAKIDMMQRQVFQMAESDPKLKGMELFDPFAWFSKDDLKSLQEPLPKFIQKWAMDRNEQYKELWETES